MHGNIENEVALKKSANASFNYKFDYCLLKTTNDVSDATYYANCWINQGPLFSNPDREIYYLREGSPCINVGSTSVLNSYLLETDKDGNPRTTSPDLGAFEHN